MRRCFIGRGGLDGWDVCMHVFEREGGFVVCVCVYVYICISSAAAEGAHVECATSYRRERKGGLFCM